MSSYYEDVYLKRLNRYGYDYQSRIQAQRERDFENKLLKSVYRVDFEFENDLHPGTLERYKQDETQTLQYLLTRASLNLPRGTVLMIPDKDNEPQPWMVYWLESIKASGYNRYIVLRMTHYITWRDYDGVNRESWAYMFGKQSSVLQDTIESSDIGAVYVENQNKSFFILPLNEFIKRDTYLEVGEGNLKEAYKITGYDIQSTPGVEYITIDPVFIRDQTPAPSTDDKDDPAYFWLNGGGL